MDNNFYFKLINSELDKKNLHELYINFLEISETVQPLDRKFIVQRYCKVTNLDIKLTIKLDVTMDFLDDNTSLYITSKITMSSDNISLRRYKTYVNDSEYFKCKYDIRDYKTETNLINGLNYHIDEIFYNLKTFGICMICRILYKNPSSEQKICNNCMFDNIFYFPNEKCIVCQEKYEKEEYTFSLSCGHIFHSTCILKLFLTSKKRECPICKEIDNN